MQTQSTAVELVDPMAPVPVPKPRNCPYADAATRQMQTRAQTGSRLSLSISRKTSHDGGHVAKTAAEDELAAGAGKHFHAYHYLNSAYPDHSLEVEYSEDPRYPAGEYPEGAYPTDVYLADEDPDSEHHLDDDDDDDDDHHHHHHHHQDLGQLASFLYGDDEDRADESWDRHGNEYCSEDQEFPDTGEEKPVEDRGDGANADTGTMTATSPEPRAQGEKGEINPYHTGARQGPNFLRRTFFAAGVCFGLVYAWDWSLTLSKPVGL